MFEYRFWVYIMTNLTNRVLYTGMTNDLPSRVQQHKDGQPGSFTTRYKVNKLVYAEEHQYVGRAIAREKQIKAWQREWKQQLIELSNPHWKDLSSNTSFPELPLFNPSKDSRFHGNDKKTLSDG